MSHRTTNALYSATPGFQCAQLGINCCLLSSAALGSSVEQQQVKHACGSVRSARRLVRVHDYARTAPIHPQMMARRRSEEHTVAQVAVRVE